MDALATSVFESGRVVAPQMFLIAVACLMILAAAVLPKGPAGASGRRSGVYYWITLAVFAAMPIVGRYSSVPTPGMAFVDDSLARISFQLALLSGVLLLLLSSAWSREGWSPERCACLLLIVAGTGFVGAANDLVTLFVSLELISIPTYVLLFLSRRSLASLEATAKYFFLSVFSSALLLFGLSYLYGSAGSTNLHAIRAAVTGSNSLLPSGMLAISAVMILAGLGFRITAVPFHFYAPDVFQGTSFETAALLAVVPKIAGFAGLLRLLSLFPAPGDAGELARAVATAVALLAVVTMTVGNVLALRQTDLKRLLAYSSVAHSGYMLVGLSAGLLDPASETGTQATLFYLAVYTVMTLGTFAVFGSLRYADGPIERTSEIEGLARVSPILALMLAAFLFSLTGLPPTGGFWGKFNLLVASWSGDSTLLRLVALAVVLNAAVGAWYYLGLVRWVYLAETGASPAPVAVANRSAVHVAAVLAAGLILGSFFLPEVLWQAVNPLGP